MLKNQSLTKVSAGWRQTKSCLWYHDKICSGMVAHVLANCEECGDMYFSRKHRAKGPKGGVGKLFCSKSCASKATVRTQDLSHLKEHSFEKGQVPHNYKGRTKHSGGYWVVTGGNKIALEHRRVMEEHLGRKLERSEIVHHINHDPTDNRIDNLMVMTHKDHIKLHWSEGTFDNREAVKRERIISEYIGNGG